MSFLSYNVSTSGNREDLTDEIFNISPVDTTITSKIGRTKASNTLHK
jgi:hypothetical protein